MEQGNYGENFDRGYEEQARPRQQVIVIGEPVPDKRTTKNLAICSLVLGILAIVFSFLPYIGIILALIALPQGIVSLVQKRPGKGLAIAGIITGIFGILLSILFILVYVVLSKIVIFVLLDRIKRLLQKECQLCVVTSFSTY